MNDSSPSSETARVQRSRVVLYHSPYCGYSAGALSLLEGRSVQPEVIVAVGRPRLRAWLRDVTGQATLPQIFIAGRSVGGFSELLALDSAGQLEVLLQDSPEAGTPEEHRSLPLPRV